MRFGGFVLSILLLGCNPGIQEKIESVRSKLNSASQAFSDIDDVYERQKLAMHHPDYVHAIEETHRALESPLSVRWWSDEAARQDSISIAQLYIIKLGHEYYGQDTVSAVFTYMEGMDWIRVSSDSLYAVESRQFAEVIGAAINVTRSPNMARLSYQAFERAKRLALDYDDPVLYHLADSSYRAIARRVLNMPDSVRSAFGPPPDRPARIPWILASLAAAFLAFGVAGGREGKRQHLDT